MNKFKPGDRIEYVGDLFVNRPLFGTVVEPHYEFTARNRPANDVAVKWDTRVDSHTYHYAHDLRLVKL